MLLARKNITRKNIDNLRKSRESLQKAFYSISSGAILLTFTIIRLVDSQYIANGFLKGSWISFGIVILLGISIKILSINSDAYWLSGEAEYEKANQTGKKLKTKQYAGIKRMRMSYRLEKYTLLFEVPQVCFFLFAIFLMIVFMLFNF